MSTGHQQKSQLGTGTWDALEGVIARFEALWLGGERPAINDYLPLQEPQRSALLLELVHSDLECRAKAGESVLVEEYFRAYPELALDRERAAGLIVAEFKLRHRCGTAVTAAEYLQRFPGFRDDLAERLPVADGRQAGIDPPPAKGFASGTLPTLPGYEIVEELGRGGMGVVYKARQIKLNRPVALKMVLSGSYAGESERARFRAEAEAVARLQHPHIVQIYEVGEHEGRAYFSMEFLEGGSLQKKGREEGIAPLEAAALVETIARAMDYAHRRRVVHRDLKPANILLTADGAPKVTDFGLAKMIPEEASQAETQAICGTPGYMAPEQAADQAKLIGPLTDVYALGAILYDLLTGRPPFLGDTALQTLEQARHQDPVPPRQLQAKVPRDLETICLKCLAKEPKRRYDSALALAQDLERFRADEAILARRERIFGKMWRKVRRRPLATAVVLVVAVVMTGAGLLVSEAGRMRRTADLVAAVEASLDASEWTAAHLAQAEELLADLEQLSPQQAEKGRARLYQAYADFLHDCLRRPRLDADELARVRESLQLLASRDQALADSVRQALEQRLHVREPIADLKAPFENLESVFDRTAVRTEGPALLPQVKGASLSTRIPCAGDVRFEVELTRAPRVKSAFGVSLAEPGKGYDFVLAVLSPERMTLQIRRGGILLRERELAVPAGPIHLAASREGNRLKLQVNDQAPVLFEDLAPLRTSGQVALQWPADVGLRSMQGSRLMLPRTSSPLERADDAYTRGDFKEALREYEAQERATIGSPYQQEARYKQALCLAALNRKEESLPLLERVAGETGQRWPLVAACDLLTDRLRAGRHAEAGGIMKSIRDRFSLEQVRLLVPQGQFYEYSLNSRNAAIQVVLFLPDPQRIPQLELGVQLADLLENRTLSRDVRRYLFRAYLVEGKVESAIATAEELFRDPAPATEGWWMSLREEYCWMLRLRGQAGHALSKLDRWLYEKPGVYRPEFLPLLLERARIQAALGRWEEAEKDLDELFRLVPPTTGHSYHYFSAAHLMRGFLYERRGASQEAQRTWRQGAEQGRSRLASARPHDLMHLLPLACLAGTDNDLEVFLGRLLRLSWTKWAGVSSASAASLLREAAASPEGRTLARQIAFRERSPAEVMRATLALGAVHLARHMNRPAALSPDQEALIRKFADDGYNACLIGKVGVLQLGPLGLTWNGAVNFPGWKAVAFSFEPQVRGPLAYWFGQRYLRLGRPKDAQYFFGTAQNDARTLSDPRLLRLAQEELDRLIDSGKR